MGSEALSKQARRDIRRAYAPEASEEVLKFVDGVKADLDQRLREEAQARNALKMEMALGLDALAARQDRFVHLTFRQRWRWLWSGSWDQ